MALYFQLMATTTGGGTQTIGGFFAVRIAGDNDPDSVGSYDVDISTGDSRWTGIVEHRYGDGAWALVATAIAAAELKPPR